MIVQEPFGNNLIRTYSDNNKMLLQVETGKKYVEAIDVTPLRYTYQETNENQ